MLLHTFHDAAFQFYATPTLFVLSTQQDGKKLVDSIDRFIQISNDNDLLKKEKIYTEWESQVFNNIQKAMGKDLEKLVRYLCMHVLCLVTTSLVFVTR